MLPPDFEFPKMTLSSLVTCWYCGLYNIPAFKVLKSYDVSEIKSGKCKLSMMKKLILFVEHAALICNHENLLNPKNEREAIALYQAVKHFFRFPSLENKTRRYETLSWKSYYNI